MCRKCIGQFFVRGDHLAPGSHCKSNVETVVHAAIETVRDGKGCHEQVLRGNGGEISLGGITNCRLCFANGPSALANRLPGDVAELCPEDVRHDESNFLLSVAPKQINGFRHKIFVRWREHPLYRHRSIEHDRSHRSRSSRTISSAEGNFWRYGFGPRVRSCSTFFKNC